MILAIDTSSAISVAVVDGEQAVASRTEFSPRGHAELLSGMVEAALSEAGVAGTDIDSIVVGTGPAPFTGLRVGLVTARTLGMVWGIPVRGVCSLDAVGAQAADVGRRQVTVVADARRREVYWATYTDGVADGAPQVSAPIDVEPRGDVVGRGALLYPDVFPHATAADPDPAWLARVAARRLEAGETEFPTEPMYMRRPDVHGVPGA
ncbi:tRNA (adenosine(37)-N6)-threonylcarbamoyltransferase complex dimerization subunit type 1 TsaB [Demequina aurantiaca]|uniref:tRNA (adenosine(37)-N6)-threonylcarbamoyltransferase complex dimerization subunit type 1 TsaB n=1 Tax=Demequina aurantiaca TaxID=676200 RepID=UPI000786685C|nr:tRNA (adenosine(37)-N6)-threonylcarbamoyltransferase complex dimerization subunit type 1 TsaB [Demequina aurantiaca]